MIFFITKNFYAFIAVYQPENKLKIYSKKGSTNPKKNPSQMRGTS